MGTDHLRGESERDTHAALRDGGIWRERQRGMGWDGMGAAHLHRPPRAPCASLPVLFVTPHLPLHTTEKRDKKCASEVESPSTQRQRLHTLQKRFQLSGSRWHVETERVALRRLRAPLLVVLLIVR